MIKKLILILLFTCMTSGCPVWALDVTWGTAVEVAADTTAYVDMKPIDTDKFVICYTDAEAGVCRVATVSGTTPTYGTANTANSNTLFDTRGGMPVAKVATDKFAVAYVGDGLGDDGFATAGNVSTRTISYGAELEIVTSDTERINGMAGITTDKFVLTLNAEADSDTCYSIVCETDATPDISCGSGLQCDGDGTTDYFPRFIDTAKIDTDKWVACFAAFDDGSDGYCVVGSASGTTITYTTDPSEFNANAVGGNDICTPSEYGGTADRFVNVASVTGTVPAAIAGTVSGTTITYGTGVTMDTSTSDGDWPACTFVTETKFLAMWEDVTNSQGTSRLFEVDWSDRSITALGDEEDFVGAAIGESVNDMPLSGLITLSGFDGVAPKVALAYIEDTDGDDLMVIIGDLSFPAVGARRVMVIQ